MSDEYNFFECPHCNEITKHLRISVSDYMDVELEGYPTGDWIAGKFGSIVNRIVPFEDAMFSVIGWGCWKCTKCSILTQRDSTGKVRDQTC